MVLEADPPLDYSYRLAIPVQRVQSRGWLFDAWDLDPRLACLEVGRV